MFAQVFGYPNKWDLYWGYWYGHGYAHYYPPITRYFEPPKQKTSQFYYRNQMKKFAREPNRNGPVIRNRKRR